MGDTVWMVQWDVPHNRAASMIICVASMTMIAVCVVGLIIGSSPTMSVSGISIALLMMGWAVHSWHRVIGPASMDGSTTVTIRSVPVCGNLFVETEDGDGVLRGVAVTRSKGYGRQCASIAATGIMVCTLTSQIPWGPVPDVISVVWISFAGILMTVLSASSSHLLRNLPDMSGADPVDTPCLDKGHFAYLEL